MAKPYIIALEEHYHDRDILAVAQYEGRFNPELVKRLDDLGELRLKEMDEAGFGNCTVTGSCEAVCPKEISLNFIAQMNREYGKAMLKNAAPRQGKGGD